jgi:hypothetical protein
MLDKFVFVFCSVKQKVLKEIKRWQNSPDYYNSTLIVFISSKFCTRSWLVWLASYDVLNALCLSLKAFYLSGDSAVDLRLAGNRAVALLNAPKAAKFVTQKWNSSLPTDFTWKFFQIPVIYFLISLPGIGTRSIRKTQIKILQGKLCLQKSKSIKTACKIEDAHLKLRQTEWKTCNPSF